MKDEEWTGAPRYPKTLDQWRTEAIFWRNEAKRFEFEILKDDSRDNKIRRAYAALCDAKRHIGDALIDVNGVLDFIESK